MPAPSDSKKKDKILIIEGDGAFGEQIADVLSRANYDTMLVKNGVEGLKAIYDALPRLIILDIEVPGADSYDILEKKNAEPLLKKIPVFLLSTQGMPINMRRVGQGSVAEFVISFKKDPVDILNRVNKFLNHTIGASPETMSVKKKIIWVEDDKLIGTILAKKLVSSGFELNHAKNGEEAMAMLASVTPDAIVLDLLLPGMSGFDILQKIAMDPNLKKIPTMILSNLSKPSDIERAKILGARKFVVKAAASLDQIVAEILELCR